jgi:lipooligosaccharide transport system ATP-binding protein
MHAQSGQLTWVDVQARAVALPAERPLLFARRFTKMNNSPKLSESGAVLLAAQGLVKSLGGRRVVDAVDLTCHAGEVLGLLGPNGAGKTTTLRMCYGFLRPDAGQIRVAGYDLEREADLARRALGVCTQDDTFDSEFTVRGNLIQTGRYYRPRIPNLNQRIDALLDQFGLMPFAEQKPATLSGGYRRRLMIARAVVHEPRVVFLDEPTTGLDPQARVAVWELINGLRAAGLAVVLTTHFMDEAARLSDRLQVMQGGRVRAAGAPQAVVGDVVGEHVVVLAAQTPSAAAVIEWFKARGAMPAQVLTHWHVPLDAPGLATFVAEFPHLQYEVRPPNLDDLFLALSVETRS